jgi:hypothetical protein
MSEDIGSDLTKLFVQEILSNQRAISDKLDRMNERLVTRDEFTAIVASLKTEFLTRLLPIEEKLKTHENDIRTEEKSHFPQWFYVAMTGALGSAVVAGITLLMNYLLHHNG